MSHPSAKTLEKKDLKQREVLIRQKLREEIDSATTFRSGVSVPEMIRETIRVFRRARSQKV